MHEGRARQALPALRYVEPMRTIGRKLPAVLAMPSAGGLRDVMLHQVLGAALVAVNSTGIAKNVYRFKTRHEADAQRDEALSRVIAAYAAIQRRRR